jgi:hypothetical protein
MAVVSVATRRTRCGAPRCVLQAAARGCWNVPLSWQIGSGFRNGWHAFPRRAGEPILWELRLREWLQRATLARRLVAKSIQRSTSVAPV